MKELIGEIIHYLMKVPHMNNNVMVCLLNPLKTEKQLEQFLDYLQKNENDEQIMRIDNLIKERRKIAQ